MAPTQFLVQMLKKECSSKESKRVFDTTKIIEIWTKIVKFTTYLISRAKQTKEYLEVCEKVFLVIFNKFLLYFTISTKIATQQSKIYLIA